MKKKRIFYLITRSEPGGAQSHVLELLKGFRNQYDLILASGEEGFLLEASRQLGIQTFLLHSLKRKISPLRDIKAYQEIRDLLLQTKPDLLHTHSSKAGILGRLAASKLGLKNIFTAHGWAFAEGTSWSRKLVSIPPEYIAAKCCDRIITVSNADKQLAIAQHICPSSKIVVIHNGIADVAEHLLAKPVNTPPVLTMVARVAPPKNFYSLLDALSASEEDYLLQIVGDGPELSNVKNHAKELGIYNKIDFMGSRDDVPEILAGSDIFILVSNWEGFPISIVEAMRAGLPVIASRVGGIAEAVIEGSNGYLVERGDVSALNNAIKVLIKSPGKRQEMGSHSRQLFEESGTTDIMLKKLSEVYDSLIT